MDLLKLSREEALKVLDNIQEKCAKDGYTSREEDFFTEQIEDLLERLVMNIIRKEQKKLPHLRRDNLGYKALWSLEERPLTPGCTSCLAGKWTQIRSSAECNAACPFCYYHKVKDDFLANDRFQVGAQQQMVSARDIKLFFGLQGEKVRGVAWVYYEPLMSPQKILPLIEHIHSLGYHQWLYTNGISADEKTLKELAAAGLDELRFNLAATHCSDTVIERMKIARKLFPHLCIESPMYTDFFNYFMGKRERILATGVEQINLAELHLNNQNLDSMPEEGPLYAYHHGYISPIKSRQLTLRLMAIAEQEKWPNVLINDCSNELKFRRDAAKSIGPFGTSSYNAEVRYRMRIWRRAVKEFDLWEAAELSDLT